MDDILLNKSAEESQEIDENDEVKAIINRYSVKRKQRLDDIIATQVVICLLIAITFFIANIFHPNDCAELLEILKTMISEEKEIMPNIFDYII